MKYKLNTGFITQKIGDKTTVFYGEKSVLFTLNDSAAYIFNGLKLGWNKGFLVKKMVEKYGITKPAAVKDIEEFTEVLLKKKIIASI